MGAEGIRGIIDGGDSNINEEQDWQKEDASDDVGVFSFCKSFRQLLPQPVGFLRRDLARPEGLPQMIGDHVVLSSLSAGDPAVFLPHVEELCLRKRRIAAIRGNEIATLRFFGISHIVDRAIDGRFRGAFYQGV